MDELKLTRMEADSVRFWDEQVRKRSFGSAFNVHWYLVIAE